MMHLQYLIRLYKRGLSPLFLHSELCYKKSKRRKKSRGHFLFFFIIGSGNRRAYDKYKKRIKISKKITQA